MGWPGPICQNAKEIGARRTAGMKSGAWRKSPAIKRSYHDMVITYRLEKCLKRLDTITPLTYALEDLQRIKKGDILFTFICSRRLETRERPHLMSWSWSEREVNHGWSRQTLSSVLAHALGALHLLWCQPSASPVVIYSVLHDPSDVLLPYSCLNSPRTSLWSRKPVWITEKEIARHFQVFLLTYECFLKYQFNPLKSVLVQSLLVL